jgi:branched-chain amino acid aminotransferase
MEPVPPDLFLQSIQELLSCDAAWALPLPGSLYIRPCLIPLDEGVSYRASLNYRFFVILSPAVNYYASNEGITVGIERKDVRAVPGGVGEAKCGGNYAAALPGLNRARKSGAEQVLWLDGIDHKYVEEVGAMNVFFAEGQKLYTPKLTGSILPGVTRSSVLQLAQSLGLQVEENRVDIDTTLEKIRNGQITEVFGCGTAAVISPITAFLDDGQKIVVGNGATGPVAANIRKTLTEIQFGSAPDPHGWRVAVQSQAH